jgi:hypothetical protein
LHSKHSGGSSAKHQIGGGWWQRISKGNTIQISSERWRQAFPLGGAGRGCWGKLFTKVASAMAIGDGWSGKAVTVAMQIASEARE